MKLGILETGRVNAAIVDTFGAYPEMFTKLYQAVDPEVSTTTYAVLEDQFPQSPQACDAWVVIGSKHGVYDPLPWIEPLKQFLREARDFKVPLIGVCFGHQLMAEAFGGRAQKSQKGWGVGVHQYDVLAKPSWMADAPAIFGMHAMHQDQVVELPEDAVCLASSAFCEFAMVAYGDLEQPDAISIQPHPEFGVDYARALLELRSASLVSPDTANAAFATFGSPVQGEAFARWSLAYAKAARQRFRGAA